MKSEELLHVETHYITYRQTGDDAYESVVTAIESFINNICSKIYFCKSNHKLFFISLKNKQSGALLRHIR